MARNQQPEQSLYDRIYDGLTDIASRLAEHYIQRATGNNTPQHLDAAKSRFSDERKLRKFPSFQNLKPFEISTIRQGRLIEEIPLEAAQRVVKAVGDKNKFKAFRLLTLGERKQLAKPPQQIRSLVEAEREIEVSEGSKIFLVTEEPPTLETLMRHQQRSNADIVETIRNGEKLTNFQSRNTKQVTSASKALEDLSSCLAALRIAMNEANLIQRPPSQDSQDFNKQALIIFNDACEKAICRILPADMAQSFFEKHGVHLQKTIKRLSKAKGVERLLHSYEQEVINSVSLSIAEELINHGVVIENQYFLTEGKQGKAEGAVYPECREAIVLDTYALRALVNNQDKTSFIIRSAEGSCHLFTPPSEPRDYDYTQEGYFSSLLESRDIDSKVQELFITTSIEPTADLIKKATLAASLQGFPVHILRTQKYGELLGFQVITVNHDTKSLTAQLFDFEVAEIQSLKTAISLGILKISGEVKEMELFDIAFQGTSLLSVCEDICSKSRYISDPHEIYENVYHHRGLIAAPSFLQGLIEVELLMERASGISLRERIQKCEQSFLRSLQYDGSIEEDFYYGALLLSAGNAREMLLQNSKIPTTNPVDSLTECMRACAEISTREEFKKIKRKEIISELQPVIDLNQAIESLCGTTLSELVNDKARLALHANPIATMLLATVEGIEKIAQAKSGRKQKRQKPSAELKAVQVISTFLREVTASLRKLDARDIVELPARQRFLNVHNVVWDEDLDVETASARDLLLISLEDFHTLKDICDEFNADLSTVCTSYAWIKQVGATQSASNLRSELKRLKGESPEDCAFACFAPMTIYDFEIAKVGDTRKTNIPALMKEDDILFVRV